MRWSSKEVRTLVSLFSSRTIPELAVRLGKTQSSVRIKASSLGLKKSKAFISETKRKMWRNPQIRKRLCERLSRSWTPEQRRIQGKKLSKTNALPEVKRRRSLARKRAFLKYPEMKNAISNASKARWKNPETRARMIAGVKESMSRPESVRSRSQQALSRWKDPKYRNRMARILSLQGGRESGLEKLIRDAFGRPHHDIPKFGWKWDMAFPKYKTFVEVQGCHVHYCPTCKRPGTDKSMRYEKRKFSCAYRNGWRVLQIRSCKAKRVLANPSKWFKEKVFSA